MANDLTKRPWFIDTASGTNVTNDDIVIRKIEVVGDAAVAGDAAIVADGTGRTITRFRATGANFKGNVDFQAGTGIDGAAKFPGLRVPTLTAGLQLYIYLA